MIINHWVWGYTIFRHTQLGKGWSRDGNGRRNQAMCHGEWRSKLGVDETPPSRFHTEPRWELEDAA